MDEQSTTEEMRLQESDGTISSDNKTNSNTECKPRLRYAWLTLLLLAVGFVFLVVGIVLIVLSKQTNETGDVSSESSDSECGFTSKEGRRLREFLDSAKSIYFDLHPHKIYFDYTLLRTRNRNMKLYKPYNPTPSTLKLITDTSRNLSTQLYKLNINFAELQLRERKAYSQAKHFLRHTFGQPYDVDYYAGDWMLGPNVFCMNPICKIRDDIEKYLRYFRPRNLDDFRRLRSVLKGQAAGIAQYMENMRLGVQTGMVRNTEACQAGSDAVKEHFQSITLYQEQGVLVSYFVQDALKRDFLAQLSQLDQYEWRREFTKSVEQTVREDLVDYIGKPIHRLIKFLDEEHLRHCVPSSVSSGLGSLPLAYVYQGGQRTKIKTTQVLPTGEALDGAKAYEKILSYFTTTNITIKQVHQIGLEQLQILYPQVLEIATNVTNCSNQSEANVLFLTILNSNKYQFNQEPFPENESNGTAYENCFSEETAKLHCPKRWQAMQKYWNEARMILSLLISKTVPMFYFNAKDITVPVCPVKMVPSFQPSIGVEAYRNADRRCSHPAKFMTPFFVENFRARHDVWSVAAHETVPGHHTQMQGYREHFQANCMDIGSWFERITYYDAMAEGWATYAEKPLIYETGIYDDRPLEKYGMLKGQIFRALRLIVDTGLHHARHTREDALALFKDYLWDTSDIVTKEVTRYQSVFGQATAYMLGKLHIEKLRRYAQETLGNKFDLKEFHYQILSQGPVPLNYMTSHIYEYVRCVSEDACRTVLSRRERNMRAKARLDKYKNNEFEYESWDRRERLYYY